MAKIISLLAVFIFFVNSQVSARPELMVVYPKNKGQIKANSTFIIGSASIGSKVTFNGKAVKVYPNGGFVEVWPLKTGINTMLIEAVDSNGQKKNTVLQVEKPLPMPVLAPYPPKIINSTVEPSQKLVLRSGDVLRVSFYGSPKGKAYFSIGSLKNIPMTEENYLSGSLWGHSVFGKGLPTGKTNLSNSCYTSTLVVPAGLEINNLPVQVTLANKDKKIEAVSTGKVSFVQTPSFPVAVTVKEQNIIRFAPDKGRTTPLPAGIKVVIAGQNGDYYKLRFSPIHSAWIKSDSVKLLPDGTPLPSAEVNTVRIFAYPDKTAVKIYMTEKLPYKIEQTTGKNSKIILTVYGVTADTDWIRYDGNDTVIKEIRWKQPYPQVYRLEIHLKNKQLWGLRPFYQGTDLVLEIKKPPVIALPPASPVKGRTIVLDPGHGGPIDTGAVGPTGVAEKTVNLAMAFLLKKYLEDAGAKVILTRETDVEVSLEDRPSKAIFPKADLLVSIHNNALPDGLNPYLHHGHSTFYYQPQSLLLAESIQNSMLKHLRLPNYGLMWDNLFLTRPNHTVAVLVEVGFMCHPEEYALICDPAFQDKTGYALFKGIEDFFKQTAEKN